MRRQLPTHSDKPKTRARFERTPRGTINNCALANGDAENNCQICEGKCPDGDRLCGVVEIVHIPEPTIADAETDQGESLDEALTKHVPERQPPRKAKTKARYDAYPELSLGEMGRIVERVFKFDFDEAYDDVRGFLAPGDDRRLDLGFLQSELDRSAEMAALAHRLYTNAREAAEIFEIDREMLVASMREGARYKLESDKRNGIRIKPITDADVLGMMQMQDPTRWRDQRIKSARMKATLDHLERLSDLARKRIDILKTLVEKR